MKTNFFIAICLFIVTISKAQVPVITYSHESGYYSSPFELTLTSSELSYQIVYTLDGSNPKNTATDFTVSSPASIQINPDGTTYRGLSPGVVIRAVILMHGGIYGLYLIRDLPAMKTFLK